MKSFRDIVGENHIAIAMGKELDDEGSMIMSQLDQIERSISMMRNVVKDPNMQIPAWVQSKVTLAADYMETVAGYMSSKNEETIMEKKGSETDNEPFISPENTSSNPMERTKKIAFRAMRKVKNEMLGKTGTSE